MKKLAFLAILMLATTYSAIAEDYVLPVFAVTMPGGNDTLWSTEAYVTNPGSETATVTVGNFLPGTRSDTPPCLPIVPPFITVPPQSTVVWQTGDLWGGVLCPEFAAGGLILTSDLPVHITSRMVRYKSSEEMFPTPLSGIGQEIDAIALLDLPKGETRMILPSVGWHPNSCGPSQLDTNVFFTNPTSVSVTIELDAAPGDTDLLVDGQLETSPFVFEVAPFSQRVLRLAGPGAPMLPVCLEPTVKSFTFTTSGPIAAIASIIDRNSGDPRTAAAIPLR